MEVGSAVLGVLWDLELPTRGGQWGRGEPKALRVDSDLPPCFCLQASINFITSQDDSKSVSTAAVGLPVVSLCTPSTWGLFLPPVGSCSVSSSLHCASSLYKRVSS